VPFEAESRRERKLVTVLFMDVVGSTALADGADPEDVSEFLGTFFRPVREEVQRFGGSIEKFIGDAVVAVFGAPVAHGDDAERAVRCALRLLEVVDRLNTANPSLRLSVRAGVATGEAVVTLGTGFERGESIATGDVLNTAARLQAAAPPGAVVVGAQTRHATRHGLQYQRLPDVLAKGKREPLEAWLAAASPATEPRGPVTPLAGRKGELARLEDIYRTVAQHRRAGLVAVVGDAGIGKSRLAAEFSAWVEAGGGQVLLGHCVPYEEAAGYRASAQQVEQLAGILESDTPEAARAKLRRAIEAEVEPGQVADVARYLSLLLGLGLDVPAAARQPIFYAVRRLVEGICSHGPAVFVFEDLHWAGESQLELLEFLVTAVGAVPALFLVLARPELTTARPGLLMGGGERTTIALGPLSADESEAMLRGLQPGPDETFGRLVEVAAGNPLFLEELAGAGPGATGEMKMMPATVWEAVAARIDALPASERAVLLDASVLGRTFRRPLLEAISERPATDLDAALAELSRRGLVRTTNRNRPPGDTEFEIKHVLIEEIAYRTLARDVRRARHGAAASFLEKSIPDTGAIAGVLAHHWRLGGDARRAVGHLLVAARRACDAMAAGEARQLFEESAELAATVDQALLGEVRLIYACSLVLLTEFTGALAILDEIIPELEGRERVEALVAAARAAYWLEDAPRALGLAGEALERAEALSDPELVPVAQGLLAGFRDLTGELAEATRMGALALAGWPPGRRQADFAAFQENLADVRYWLGDYPGSEDLARAAYELAGESHSIEPLLRGGGWRGLALAAQGRTEEALEWLDSIIARAQELDPRWGAPSLNYSSLPLRDLQLFEEARGRNEHALEIVRVRGAWGMPEMQAEIDIQFTDLELGEYGRVQRALPRLWEAALNGKAWRPWLGGSRLALVRARLAEAVEAPEAAAEQAADAIERARRVGRIKYEADAQLVLGRALVAMGRQVEGLDSLRAAVATADRLGQPSGRWRAWGTLSRVLERTGDDRGAEAAQETAAAVIRDYAEGLSEKRAASFLAAPAVREILTRG